MVSERRREEGGRLGHFSCIIIASNATNLSAPAAAAAAFLACIIGSISQREQLGMQRDQRRLREV